MNTPQPEHDETGRIEFDTSIFGAGLIAVPPAALTRLARLLGRRPSPGYRVRVVTAPAPPVVVVRVEVPPQAHPVGHMYLSEVQLDGDEQLCIGTELQLIDEGGVELAAVVEDIAADEYGPVYRVRLTPPTPSPIVENQRGTPAEVRTPVHVQTDQQSPPPDGRHRRPDWPEPGGVRQVTQGEIDALAATVAAFEAAWGVSSRAMFDDDDRLVANLEETEELHQWAAAWVRLNAIDPSATIKQG